MAGPSSGYRCKFPFKQNFGNYSNNFPSCSLSHPPFHEECNMLQRFNNWTDQVPHWIGKVKIRKF